MLRPHSGWFPFRPQQWPSLITEWQKLNEKFGLAYKAILYRIPPHNKRANLKGSESQEITKTSDPRTGFKKVRKDPKDFSPLVHMVLGATLKPLGAYSSLISFLSHFNILCLSLRHSRMWKIFRRVKLGQACLILGSCHHFSWEGRHLESASSVCPVTESLKER